MLMLNVLGGLAIFVFGMKMMSDGLHKSAGEKMKNILGLFTSNRYTAIATGAVVTAVVQSSSVTTTMVIGFINAGLLSLVQSIGIIFGANIGTTITAQLVAFNISWVVMPSIIIGVCMLFVRNLKVQHWGEAIVGFGLLFLGMIKMGSELRVLAENPIFRNAFASFDCAPIVAGAGMPMMKVLGALFIGVFTTMIIQSSSACTGIIIAMGGSGLINIYTAVVLVLGSNIGTTVTAQLAAITANRVGKQAALAHTLFNVIGVVLTILSFAVPWPGEEMPFFFAVVSKISASGSLPRQIANAHTVFNVCTTLILIPAIPFLARICEKVIPLKSGKKKIQELPISLLGTPVLALQQTTLALQHMVSRAWKMIDSALRVSDRNDKKAKKLAPYLLEREKKIDEMQHNITDYLERLMEHSLTPDQAQSIPLLIHCTNDAERVGDHTESVLNLINAFNGTKKALGTETQMELNKLYKLLSQQARLAKKLLRKSTVEQFAEAKKLKKQVVILCDLFEGNQLARLDHEKVAPTAGLFYIELIAEIKKISRHFGNITDRAQVLNKLV